MGEGVHQVVVLPNFLRAAEDEDGVGPGLADGVVFHPRFLGEVFFGHPELG